MVKYFPPDRRAFLAWGSLSGQSTAAGCHKKPTPVPKGGSAMPVRNIYLKIETIPDYSPVSPDKEVAPPIAYERDCMRNPGHEDTKIPPDEVNARRLTALVYREYLDPGFIVPKPDKLIVADINEPAFDHRVPGAVIYARPRDRLCIHVN